MSDVQERESSARLLRKWADKHIAALVGVKLPRKAAMSRNKLKLALKEFDDKWGLR